MQTAGAPAVWMGHLGRLLRLNECSPDPIGFVFLYIKKRNTRECSMVFALTVCPSSSLPLSYSNLHGDPVWIPQGDNTCVSRWWLPNGTWLVDTLASNGHLSEQWETNYFTKPTSLWYLWHLTWLIHHSHPNETYLNFTIYFLGKSSLFSKYIVYERQKLPCKAVIRWDG